jgi:hypothetical protein
VSAKLLFDIVFSKTLGQKCLLPFMHIMRQNHIMHIDYANLLGAGFGAVVVQGGEDKSKALLVAPSILAYLENHL